MKQVLLNAIYNGKNINISHDNALKLMRIYNLFLMSIGHDTLANDKTSWVRYPFYWVQDNLTRSVKRGYISGYDLLYAMAYDNQFIEYLSNNPNTSIDVINLVNV
jgi:hypothetical protein